MSALRRWGPWVLLVAVAAVGLSIGLNRSGRPSLDAQVLHIAGEVRCPVCDGESAAESSAAPSVEIRAEIRHDLQGGEKSNEILSGFVRSYGPGILEKPRTNGLGLLVWILPVIAVAAGATFLGFAFSRWKSQPSGASTVGSDLSDAVTPFEDPERYGPDPATVAKPVSDAPGPPVAVRGGPGRRRRRHALIGAGVVLATGGACWAVILASSARLPGEAVSGATLGSETLAADIQKAQSDTGAGRDVDAIKEYQKVLATDVDQPEALTGEGWLLAETQQPDLLRQGIAMLSAAERVDPGYSPARVYRGIALLSEDDYTDSIPELEWYLAHQPDPALVAKVKAALQQAETAVKAANSAGPGPTSAPNPPTTSRP